ncbi:glucose-1-phosphate adenylyltransferase [Neobacillus sp. FSL H8-0543]|uniref:glucose-1-phosphate adenylyltransferase n=1 Tax=Neobacillus sp. FSL H8-0543 TaxID=2954672 RepID=UPI0031586224
MRKQKWIAMLLAGGKGTRLKPLTNNSVKPAVPFGGKYRIIDFALSNCKNSGIETVGILTDYRPLVLYSHLGIGSSWAMNEKKGGVTFLPEYLRKGGGQGTSHAVYQYIEFIELYSPKYVLILSADQVYKMDYSLMLEQHIETQADCTIAVVEVPWEEANRFGIIKLDRTTLKINDFEEKPVKPTSNLASMGVYIFSWQVLKEYLWKEEQKEISDKDFGKDIIPSMLRDGMKLYAYYFNKYWRDVGTVFSYWQANLDLLNKEKNIFLKNPEWRIDTVTRYGPPLFIDERAMVHHSLLSEGCEIYGTIEKSVIFNGVKVEKGASIKNSVILPDTIIEKDVWIENAVIGSQSLIRNGVIMISRDPEMNLLVVGHQKTIDPTMMENTNKNNERTLLSS